MSTPRRTVGVNDLIPRHLLPEHARIEAEIDDELYERRTRNGGWHDDDRGSLFTADDIDRFDARDAGYELNRAEQEAADQYPDGEADLRAHQDET